MHPAGGRALILTDGKPGHENQSRALANALGWDFDLVPVVWRHPLARPLSYVFDRLDSRCSGLFCIDLPDGAWTHVIACGSATYYPAKVLARRLGIASVAMMLPRGYRFDFDRIFAQEHDDPPSLPQVTPLPVNACCPQPQGHFRPPPGRPCAAFIIGGDSGRMRLDVEQLRQQLSAIMDQLGDWTFVATTSRRTSEAVDALLKSLPLHRFYCYREVPINPIPDFLQHCDRVVLTADSTSMISEAVCFGRSRVDVLPVAGQVPQKHQRLVDSLARRGCLHRFDGKVGEAGDKIDLVRMLREAMPSCG